MKEFEVAVRAAELVEEDKFEFKIKGNARVFTAYRATPAQMAVALSTVGRHTSITTKVAGIIDFFAAVLDEDDAAFFCERLLSRSDPFELEGVEQILSWLVEEWSGHPTQEPSGSAPLPVNIGPTSTPAPEPSISSDSPSTVLSTSSTPGAWKESAPMIGNNG